MKIEPDEPRWVWIDEVSDISDESWWRVRMGLKEEKPVKQIDFSKPLRTSVAKYPARVVKEGMTVLEYETSFGSTQRIVVDETGAVYAEEKARPIGAHNFVVENVPEEPVDTLIVYQGHDGDFRIDRGGDDQNRYARSQAERIIANTRFYRNAVLVKVPA